MVKKERDVSFNKYLDKIDRLEKKISDKDIDEVLRENRYLYSLLEVTQSISTPRDFDQLLELIVDSAISLTRAERGFLMLFRKDGNLEFKVTRNIDKKTIEGKEFRISRTVVNRVLASGTSLFLGDIYESKEFEISESIEALRLRMVMCVPLKTKERLLGVIYVDSQSETEKFTKLEERLLETFAAQASVAIDNANLYDSSVRDALTELFNYGYLRDRLEKEISRALRYERDNISFIMLDLDNFKALNDTYGHIFGNKILIKVAELIRDSVRKCDIAARYGGDEFAILMPETDVAGARQLGQRLQKMIAELQFVADKGAISVTVSIGISTFPVEKIVDSESIVVEADHALFVAKGKGKNQIAVFGLRKDEKKIGPELIGTSPATKEISSAITKLAKTDATVLIVGETGTGKELVTHLVHNRSPRAAKPLVIVSCGAIPDALLESELFGYEKGAFTGAYTKREGKFEQANGGTIFLDEIGELPMHLQVKILRAIEQKTIDHIGGDKPIKVDVRVIAATNRNLEEEIENGNFRKDLFYRLSVATIHLPPLRKRPEDVEVLSDYYLNQMNLRYHRKILGFTKNARETLMNNPWSGNVRELIHRIERAVIMATGQYLDENDLGLMITKPQEQKTIGELRGSAEKEGIMLTLTSNRWNITQSARKLGITPKTLRYLMKKHNIVKPTANSSK